MIGSMAAERSVTAQANTQVRRSHTSIPQLRRHAFQGGHHLYQAGVDERRGKRQRTLKSNLRTRLMESYRAWGYIASEVRLGI